MERAILRHVPNNWDVDEISYTTPVLVSQYSNEYRTVESQLRMFVTPSNLRIKTIKRNQNVHDFGQYLLRQQLMSMANPTSTYYKVRRFTTVRNQYLRNALDYNIDPRRCGKASLTFQKNISCDVDDVILVVQVISSEQNCSSITPSSSSEYFIEYIVEKY